mmetsp:Transcript_9673/g.12087  ORF Transcript_9673/g.12087 Transcript_9673/m.12087 type:complete len:104 (-) Transcript_9673:944-1255(-)
MNLFPCKSNTKMLIFPDFYDFPKQTKIMVQSKMIILPLETQFCIPFYDFNFLLKVGNGLYDIKVKSRMDYQRNIVCNIINAWIYIQFMHVYMYIYILLHFCVF